jgi:thiol-disulfide isomerase/thioredoxin
MKYSLGFLFLLCVLTARAQTDSSNISRDKVANIPAFDLLQIDSSSHFTRDMLKKNRETLIMFFSPDCPHCQHMTGEIIAAIHSLKRVQIVMATYQPFEEMVDFYKKYQLANYPAITVGRDSRFSLPPLYGMTQLPYLALYNKKGRLITTFDGGETVDKIREVFKKNKK